MTATPTPETLMAACEGLAALIRGEFGEVPIAEEVRIHTDATPEQVAAVAALDAYWAAKAVEERIADTLIGDVTDWRPTGLQRATEDDSTDY